MRRYINVGGKDIAFEANLGSAELYEILTGKNLFDELNANKVKTKEDPEKDKKSVSVLSVYKKLAFVMCVQAQEPDIKAMKARMNDDEYITWLFNFDVSDFNNDFILDITDLWTGSQRSTSESKNP